MLTLPPPGPPFGPGLIWVASEAMPLENTAMDAPSMGTLVLPNFGRIERARASPSAEPSARRISAVMRPQVLSFFSAGVSVVLRQMPMALA